MDFRNFYGRSPMLLEEEAHLFEELPPNDGTIYKLVIRSGMGNLIEDGSLVKLRYRSSFNIMPYTIFEDIKTNGGSITITLGNGDVITVWEKLIKTMCIYELSVFVVSSKHCFGKEGVKNLVPPNMDIRYTIEILDAYIPVPSDIEKEYINAQQVVQKAKENMEIGNYLEAARQLSDIYGLFSNSWGFETNIVKHSSLLSEMRLLLIRCLRNVSKFEIAIMVCQEALELNKKDYELIEIMYDIYMDTSEYQKAIKFLESMLPYVPENTSLIKQHIDHAKEMLNNLNQDKRNMHKKMLGII